MATGPDAAAARQVVGPGPQAQAAAARSRASAPFVKALALQLPSRRYRTITWREGTNSPLTSCFAAIRVRSAHRDYWRAELPPEQWLLIEWPRGEPEPTKNFLGTLPAPTSIKELVRLAKLRWRIERDYQELKQELGLGHFEGRSWRGFHHHATLCIASYAFLFTQRLAAPKKLCRIPFSAKSLPYPPTSGPGGSPVPAAPRPRLDHDAAPETRRGTDRPPRSVSVLRQNT